MLNSVHSLYNENENIKKLNGFYRGTVLKHLYNGKCKVFIYGVYNENYINDPDKLPDAEQAMPIFGGSYEGSGMFSYPNLGSTVWCFFQNGDQNYPVIFATTLAGSNARKEWTNSGPFIIRNEYKKDLELNDNSQESNTEEKEFKPDIDSYVHKIKVKRSEVELNEAGFIKITTRNKDNTNTCKIILDADGNLTIDSTVGIYLISDLIRIQATKQLDFQSDTIHMVGDSKITLTTPFAEIDSSKGHTVIKHKSYSKKNGNTGVLF